MLMTRNTGGPGNFAFDREEAAWLRGCGLSLAEVADRLGVRKQSVHRALRRLGDRWTLQAARHRIGWSQYLLARALGVTRGQLALWEQGRKRVPPHRRLRLAATLWLAEDRIEWGGP